MIGFVRFVYLLALVVWIGEVVFFSFVVAPAVFGVLGAAGAGDVVAAIFPRYYGIGMVASAIAVACALLLRRRASPAGWWVGAAVALALGCAATVVAGTLVYPQAERLRAAVERDVREDFRRTHRLAVALNGAALLAGLVGLGCSAAALRH